jgi:eukaryotic-like serine/threonine-protein kinase
VQPDLEEQLAKGRVKAALLGTPQAAVRLGRFEILRCLGRGGHGAVYEAREDPSLPTVALKCLHPADHAQRSALQREFRAATRLVHPNLVTLHELFCADEHAFFTMELVRGGSLLAQLAGTSADHTAICTAFLALLAGLRVVHAAGKVHRDLKPSNVLLTEHGRIVILDYGLMIDRDRPLDGSRSGASGTPFYRAPEQVSGGEVGPKADLYAVGKMLAQALWTSQSTATDSALQHTLALLADDLQERNPMRRPSAEQALARLSVAAGRPCRENRSKTSTDDPLVGREAERSALHASLASAQAGEAAIVWLEGESGMGKSALLRAFAAEATQAGASVLEGRCYERENAPFKVFDGIVTSLARRLRVGANTRFALAPEDARALTQLFPELAHALSLPLTPGSQLDPRASQQRAFAALRLLLGQLAAERPLLIMVDDLQWGDADSARLMLSLLLPALPAGVLFVGAYRPSERDSSPFLRRVLGSTIARSAEARASVLTLTGLNEHEVQVLARALGHSAALAEESALALLRAADGMPFLLCELLTAARLEPTGHHDSLAVMLEPRVRRCSSQARRLLDILCIAGRPLSLAIGARAAHLGEAAWTSAQQLCTERLARWRESDDGRELEPYHDIVRTWIAEHALGSVRMVLHRALAEALELTGEDDVEFALEHWLHAGEVTRARSCALLAANHARASLAWVRAAELYRLALRLSPGSAPEQAALHEALADVLSYAGEHAAAGEAYERAAEQVPADRASALYRTAATQLLLGGKVERGLTLTREALSAVGIALPESELAGHAMWVKQRARLSWRSLAARLRATPPLPGTPQRHEALRAAYRGFSIHDPARGAALHMQYLAEVRGMRNAHELEALAWEAAQQAMVSGPYARASVARMRDEVQTIAASLNQPYTTAIATLLEASYLLHCCERPADALIWLNRAEEILETCPGTHLEQGWLRMLRDYVVLNASEVDLRAYWVARERESRTREDAYSQRQLLLAVPLRGLFEDKPADALSFLDRGWPLDRKPSNPFDFMALSSRCDLLVYQADAAGAYALLRANWHYLTWRHVFKQFDHHFAYLRARNAVALYAQTRAPALAHETRRFACVKASLPRLTQGLYRGLQACLAIADGNAQEARALLEAASADLVQAQHHNLAWLVRYRLAQISGDGPGFARAEAFIRARGIRALEPWVSVLLPVAQKID